MKESKYEAMILFGIILVLITLESFALFGIAGFRTVLGFAAIVFAPFYLIFNNFSLSGGEKIAFSFFAGITVFPSMAYWLGFAVSFKISIFIIFAALLIVAYTIKKQKKK